MYQNSLYLFLQANETFLFKFVYITFIGVFVFGFCKTSPALVSACLVHFLCFDVKVLNVSKSKHSDFRSVENNMEEMKKKVASNEEDNITMEKHISR